MELDFTRRPLQHGELVLRPIMPGSVPEGKTVTVRKHVVAHSESGAHHVVMAPDFEVTTVRNDDGTETMYLVLSEAGELVHEKTGPDQHATLPVVDGAYVVMTKKDWDPFAQVVRNVAD